MSEVKLLTAAAVERYKPVPGKVREVKDSAMQGLYLAVHPSGTKVFIMKLTRPDGRSGHLTLGRVDLGAELEGDPVIGQPLSLAAARMLAAKVHRDRQLGKDVIGEHKASKRRQRLQVQDDATNTFAAAAKLFIERYCKTRQRRWKDTAVALGWNFNEAEPNMTHGSLAHRWADKPVRDIDDAAIFEVVREAGHSGIPGTKARFKGHSDARERAVFAALSGMFAWLKAERKVQHNPCIGAVKVAPFKVRERVLSNDEIRWLWQACDAEGWPFGPIVKLLLLTGQRLNEVAGMRRSELSDGALNLPGSRTKNHRPHIVPLCQAALDLIPAGEPDVVFTTTGTTPVSGWSTLKARLDKRMAKLAGREIPDWVLHDLRRTAVTGMNELGIPPHIVEQVVNHISGAKASVAGTYNRSLQIPERRAALQRWADHLEGLVNGAPDNVVSIRRAKA